MKFDENLSSLHGYLCGDGYVTRNKETQMHKYYVIGFRNINIVLLNDFQRRFKEYFNFELIISKDKDRCKIGNKEIYFTLTKDFSYYSYEWKIPKLSKKNLRCWLRAFFDCEAWVENQPKKSRLIGLDCCNKSGLFEVREALNKYGICSNISKRKNRTIWGLNICGLDNLKRFRKIIDFLHPNKNKKLTEAINSYVNYYWDIPLNKKDFVNFIKFNGKIRGKEIRLFSIKLKNLKTVRKLLNRHQIKSKIGGPWINNHGSINYSLTLKEEDLWNKKDLKNLKK